MGIIQLGELGAIVLKALDSLFTIPARKEKIIASLLSLAKKQKKPLLSATGYAEESLKYSEKVGYLIINQLIWL